MEHRIEQENLRLLGINSLDRVGRYDKILLGRNGAVEQLETMKTLIRNMGEANYPVLELLWNFVDVPGHYPVLEGDTSFQHRSKAYVCSV